LAYVDTQFRRFVVGERPFCYWALDIGKQTSEFLESIDPTYFESMANVFFPHYDEIREDTDKTVSKRLIIRLTDFLRHKGFIPDCDPQHAALTLRMIYSQALETMFSLLCGSVQAPRCIHAWMLKYRPSEVREILRNIEKHESFPWLLRAKQPSWYVISDYVLMSLVLEDKEKEEHIKRGFARFWSRLAADFVKQPFTDEYNSIKHGLRVRSGGFSLAIGLQDEPGIPAPKERMRSLGSSEFGSTFNIVEQIGDHNHHFQSKRSSRNWSPTDLVWALHLITMSLTNVIGSLRILNGKPAEQVRFEWPEDFQMFDEPWKRSMKLGITSMEGFGNQIPPYLIEPYSRESILTEYLEGNDGGVIRRVFGDEHDGSSSS